MERMLRGAGVLGFALLASACGGRVDPLDTCPPEAHCLPDGAIDDSGVPYDSALPDTGYPPPPDSGSPDSWYPPPPDAYTCGSGPCSPGYTCPIPCGSCTCLAGGGWMCSGSTGCVDSGPYPDSYPDSYPVCPAVEPYDGQYCGGSEGASCAWPNSCGTTDYGYCSGSRWSVKAEVCPGGCPPYRPSEGSPCGSTAPYPYCKYPSACGGTDLAYCTGGRWTFGPSDCPPPPPPCPYSTPPVGSYCADEGAYCYTTSTCGGSDVSRCVAHAWNVSPGPCLPPPPPPCPGKLPADGTYCPSEKQECYFPTPCGTSDYAVCYGGAWHTKSSCTSGSCPAYEPPSGTYCSTPSSTMCNYAKPYGCSTSCFCAKDYRWACYDAPCYPPPYDGGFTDGGSGWVDGF
jgi:hypothetical protein